MRLTDRFFPAGKVAADAVEACRNHVRSLIEHFHRAITTHGFEVAVASSGTAETVARIAHALTGEEPLRTYNCYEISREKLDDVVARLVKHRTASARTKMPGLEAHRADIIVAGTLILATVAETFDVESFLYSEAALREGVLLDTISRRRGGLGTSPPPRCVAAEHPPARRAL